MAEELTRSLTALAKRGEPRGAAVVLADARRNAERTWRPASSLRPAWVAATTFAATLLVIGGSLAVGLVLRHPDPDAGSAGIREALGNAARSASLAWLAVPALVVTVALVTLIAGNRMRSRKERAMATTIETTPTRELESAGRPNRWLVVTVIVLALALIGLGAWVIYDQASEPETAATAEIASLYDDYLAAYNNADAEGFLAVTADGYTFKARSMSRDRAAQATEVNNAGEIEVALVGDLIMTGEGPGYYVAAGEQITVNGIEYFGVSAYRVVDGPEGLRIIEHTWVGEF